jgi:hypothetical protein
VLFYHKNIHRAFLLMAIVALLTVCRTEVFYENYDETGYKEDGLTKAEFIEDFWTCEKHKTRLHKALIPIQYGYASGVTRVPDTIPNAYSWPQGGGCVIDSRSPRFAAVAKCSKCQKEFRKYKRIRKRE